MERTGYEPGTPCWVDLAEPDVDASVRFYAQLFGWQAADQGADMGGYRICTLRGAAVAGIMPQQQGAPPAWITYISVTDTDLTAKAVTSAGGQVLVGPIEVPNTGRMALCADPTGAVFGLWQPRPFVGAELVDEPGALTWNELTTRETAAAVAFYRAVLGWDADTRQSGPLCYTEWKSGGRSVAGMMPMDGRWPADTPAHWMTYFLVADTDATVAKAAELGATVVVPASDIPPGRFAVLADPQGATFSVIKVAPELSERP
ncbi:MAG TPA: VOC family protein [Amycolatopsis sp.]|nr:VOC family protein [Amycolatopsis sp.]